MIDRRAFMSLLAGTAAVPGFTWGQTSSGKIVLYASVGPELTQYDVDVKSATLTKRGSVRLPANVQYAWPHASRRYLYVASSDSASGLGGFVGKNHHASAFRIDPATGALTPHGAPALLPSRPIHNSTDRKSEYLLTAYNNPSAVTVHRINRDGTLDEEVRQSAPIDAGIFAHQVLATPNNRLVVLVTRGNDAEKGKPEDPGALKIYHFKDGLLTNGATVAPGGGVGFGVRHLDFHPTRPWVYVSNERRSKLETFRLDGDRLAPAPLFVKDLLAEPGNVRPRQLGGTVHVHPNGRYVYGINRCDHRVSFEGKQVYGGGENSLAVFAIDQATGEPALIQHVDTQGFHPRTFHIDPSGRMLVAAHIMAMPVRAGSNVVTMPANLSVFRIGGDGKLGYLRKYDVDVGKVAMWWMGMVPL
jgi:6-phosphogluconolactonase